MTRGIRQLLYVRCPQPTCVACGHNREAPRFQHVRNYHTNVLIQIDLGKEARHILLPGTLLRSM